MGGYVHRYESVDRLWSVGWFDPVGKWHVVSAHDQEDEASNRVHFLNGGNLATASCDFEMAFIEKIRSVILADQKTAKGGNDAKDTK